MTIIPVIAHSLFRRELARVFAFVVLLGIFDSVFSFKQIVNDFAIRYNEVECLNTGISPFDVWSGKIQHFPYYSFHGQAESGLTKRVHDYPPLEYAFFLPLSFLEPGLAYKVFILFEILGLAFVLVSIFKKGSTMGDWKKGPVFVNCVLGAIIVFCVCGGGFNSIWLSGIFSGWFCLP